MRSRRLARLFTLALILELALLCCACAQAHSHCCPGDDRCAICQTVRLGLRDGRLAFALLLTPLAVSFCLRGLPLSALQAVPATLVARKVRLND